MAGLAAVVDALFEHDDTEIEREAFDTYVLAAIVRRRLNLLD